MTFTKSAASKLAFLLVCAGAFAQSNSSGLESATRYLIAAVNQRNYADFGFRSFDEVARASLGQPIRLHRANLRSFNKDSNPAKFLVNTNEWIYPVLAGKEVRCEVILAQRSGKWIVISLGDSKLAPVLFRARENLQRERDLPSTAFYAVQVMGPQLFLLAHQVSGQGGAQSTYLTTLLQRFPADSPPFTTLPASTVLLKLAKEIGPKTPRSPGR